MQKLTSICQYRGLSLPDRTKEHSNHSRATNFLAPVVLYHLEPAIDFALL